MDEFDTSEIDTADTVTSEQVRRSVTVEEYGEHWLSPGNSAQVLRRSTVGNYRTALRSYIAPLIGDVRLMDLSPWHVCHLLVRMQDEGFAPGTGRRVLMVLSSMLWQAKRERLVCRNVAAHLEPPGKRWPPYLAVNGFEGVDRTKAATHHRSALR